jgi:vitamin K-dependent gamma-carboxylase
MRRSWGLETALKNYNCFMKQKTNILNSVSSYLFRPSDASTLGAFRIFFGLILFWSTSKYFIYGAIKPGYIDKKFFFPYELFPWVTLLPGDGMYYLFFALALSSIFLALGLFYRVSALVFFLSYAYIFLLEQTNYNNHYYFICLLGFLFCFINADRWMALDSIWKKRFLPSNQTSTVPYWNILLIKAQVFIVYFYGGIAKLNGDWLRGEPIRHFLVKIASKNDFPEIIAQFMQSELGAYFFSYGGLVFDLSIGFLLLYKKTRLPAFILILFFNVSNNFMFKIGVFPLLMISATIIFFEAETPRVFIQKFFPRLKQDTIEPGQTSSLNRYFVISFVSIYLAVQVLLPFRHWLYEGNVSWTEEGQYFSWHMMLRSKYGCGLFFVATNPETGKSWSIQPEHILTRKQFSVACPRPGMIVHLAHHFGNLLKEQGIKDPSIQARATASLNYRPHQIMINPTVNLIKVSNKLFEHSDWIVPLINKPMRTPAQTKEFENSL